MDFVKKNKKKYANFEFEKPAVSIIVIHFLLHINLIILGPIIASSCDASFCNSTMFLLLISVSSTTFACLYIFEAVFSGSYVKMIKKEDYSLDKISDLLSSSNPIEYAFLYVKGTVNGRKGKTRTCYSKNGFSLPIQSSINSPLFNKLDYEPDYFYLKTTQKVNMTDQLFLWIARAKEKLISCENKHNAQSAYYPQVEGDKLILREGCKIPAKMKKSNAIASLLFGLGIYPELLAK